MRAFSGTGGCEVASGSAVGSSPDVLVVGAGVIGLTTALALRRRGLAVAMVEAGAAARESSWAGAGVLTPMPPWRYPEPIWALSRRSLDLYPALAQELWARTGIDPELTLSGMLVLDPGELAAGEAWCQRNGRPARRLASAAGGPGRGGADGEALLLPWVQQIRNPRFCRALVARLGQLGVTIHAHEPVTGWQLQGARVTGVRTARQLLTAGCCVLAAGAWSGELARPLGIEVPVRPVRGQMLLLRLRPGQLGPIVMGRDGLYLVPRRDGRVLVGSTVETAGFDKTVTAPAREALWHFARERLPQASEADIEAQWAGLRPGSADGSPLLGAVAGRDGLLLSCGHYRNGLAMAPASAEAVADLLCGQVPAVDLRACAPGRFQRQQAAGERSPL